MDVRKIRKRKRKYLHQNSPLAPLYSSTRKDTKKDTDVILNDDAWVHIEQKNFRKVAFEKGIRREDSRKENFKKVCKNGEPPVF